MRKSIFKVVIIIFLLLQFTIPVNAVVYSYDELNRVTSVTYDENNVITYEYDNAGNILQVISSKAATSTNLLNYSHQLDNPDVWYSSDVNINPNVATAPDSLQTADEVTVTTGWHFLKQMVDVEPNSEYCFSFYAQNQDGMAASYSVYDNTNSADIVPATSYITQINDSDYTRITVPFTTPEGCTSIGVYLLRDSGMGVDILLANAQLNTGLTAAPYEATPNNAVIGVSLNKTSTTIAVGNTEVLSATITPADATNQNVTWSSSDEIVATVDENGVVTAVADGTATITVTTADGGYTAQCSVTVTAAVATNLLNFSHQLDETSVWYSSDINIDSNVATAPDSLQTADEVTVTTGWHFLKQMVDVGPNTEYCFSFYAKNQNGTAASYSVYDSTNDADLVPATSYISQINDSDYTRITVPFTTPAECTSIGVYLLRDSGMGVDVLLANAQLNTGLTAAPYEATP